MTRTIETLAVKAVLDMQNIDQGFQRMTKEAREAMRIVSSLETPLDKLARKQERLNEIFANGGLSQQQYLSALSKLRARMDDLAVVRQPDLSKMLGQVPGIGSLVVSLTTAAGAIGLVNAAFNQLQQAGSAALRFIIDRGKAIDDVADAAERLGVSVGGLSELQTAAKFADVKDFAAVTGGIEKMLVAVARARDPASETAKAFQRLRLDANELIGLQPDQIFHRIAKEIAEIPTNAERAMVIREIFGKAGNDLKLLIEQFEQFREKSLASGAIVTDEQAAAVAEVDDALKSINATMESIGNTSILVIVPAMKSFAEIMKQVDQNSRGLQSILGSASPMLAGFVGEFEKLREQERENARSESAIRRMQQSSPEQKALNEAASAEADENRAAKERVKLFDRLIDQYNEQILLLEGGRQAVEDHKMEEAGLSEADRHAIDLQRQALEMLKEEKQIRDAISHAADQDAKLKGDRINEAEKIRQSLQTAEEAASVRLARAMDLVVTGELTESDVEKLAEKEARSLTKGGGEFRLQAVSRGSQEDIAATLGRRQESDSQRFEVMKQKLIELAKKPPLEVNNVGAF